MNGKEALGVDGAAFVDGLTNHIDDSAEGAGADGNLNGVASVDDWLAADETLSGVKSDGAHVVATQVLGDLEDEAVLGAFNFERVENRRKLTLELHIDDGANDLRNLARSRAELACKQR